MEIPEGTSDTSVPPSLDASPSSKGRSRLSQTTTGSTKMGSITQIPANEASGDAAVAAPAPSDPVAEEASASAPEATVHLSQVDPAPVDPGQADQVPGNISPELFRRALTLTGDGAVASEASAEALNGGPRVIGRSGSGSSRVPPSAPTISSPRPSRTPPLPSPSLTSASLTYDASPRHPASIPSVGSLTGGPSVTELPGPSATAPPEIEPISPRRSNTAPAAGTPPAARSKRPAAAPAAVEPPPVFLNRRASGSSIPTKFIVEPAAFASGRSKHRPLVMPFLERQGPVGAVGGGGGGVEGRTSSRSVTLAPAAGRRSGPVGAIRLGPAHSTPIPQASDVSNATAASGARDSHGRVRRPDQDAHIHHSNSITSSPAYRHFHVFTNEGDDVFPAPPLLPAASREWERGARAGDYAAGGGAAAVKAATAAAAAAATTTTTSAITASHSMRPAEQHLHQQLMLGEAVHIRSIRKANVAPASERTAGSSTTTVGMAGVGVPGRRGRRMTAHAAGTSSATAAAMTAYFASVEASIADGTAPDQMLLPSGLARRLKAARMMASGPPPFQRRREQPPPPSPAGIKLDGFMLLEAADEEMPEAVQGAVLSARHISAVESADLSYFVALRSLDVSDNKLPDLVCLAPLATLVRLRAAACRLTSLGKWPGQTVETGAASAAATAGGGGGGGASVGVSAGPHSVVTRVRSRLAAAAGAGTGTGTGGAARPGSTEQGSGRPGTGSTAAASTETDARGTTPEGSLQQQRPLYTDLSIVAPSPVGTDPLTEPLGPLDSVTVAAAAVAGADMHEISSVLLPGPSVGLALPLPPFQYLEVLDLSFNQLQPHMVLLPGCPLARLPRLTELDLSGNHFKRLPSPAEIWAAAAGGGGTAGGATGASRASLTAVTAAAVAAMGPAFPALRRLRLTDNGLTAPALASLATLAPPCLTHLDLSRNAIFEAPPHHLFQVEQPSGPPGPSSHSTGLSNTPPQHRNRKGSPAADTAARAQPQHASQTQPPQRQPSPQSLTSAISASAMSSTAASVSLSGYLVRLTVLDLTYNRVASEAAVAPLLTLPSLQRLLLAGNPVVVSLQRSDVEATRLRVIDLGQPDALPPKPSVAASLTGRFARIAETAPKQHANTLAAAAAAAITAATAPERVSDVFDRTDATIEQWRLNTVMEEDEEDEEEDVEETSPDDRTFLTGVGITESSRQKADPSLVQDMVTEPSGVEPEDDDDVGASGTATQSLGASGTGTGSEDRPLWESISDPTERLAVALGLDPLSLPMHTDALTTDAAGAIAALRFALAHPLVEANAGLGPHPGYIATTTAAQLKRKPRRAPAPQAPARLAPMGATAAAVGAGAAAPPLPAPAAAGIHSPKTVKIQTMEALLDGMKGKLAALEASLTAQLAAVPPPPGGPMTAFGRKQGRGRRRGRRARDSDSDDDDDDSSGSGLPDDVIDQIERESDSEEEDKRAVEEEMGPMDPREGLVLVADQIMTDDSSMDPRALNAALSRDPSAASPLSRATTVTLLPAPSPSPNTRSTQQPPSPTRTNSSPLRGSVNASAASVAAASRKGGGAGPHVVPATPVALPGGAASALGYAA